MMDVILGSRVEAKNLEGRGAEGGGTMELFRITWAGEMTEGAKNFRAIAISKFGPINNSKLIMCRRSRVLSEGYALQDKPCRR